MLRCGKLWEIQKPKDPEKLEQLHRLELLLDNAESYKDLPEWMVYPELVSHYAMERVQLRKQIAMIKKELKL